MSELYGAALRAVDLTRQLLLVGRRDIVEPVLLELNTVVIALDNLVRQALGENIQLRLELGDELGLVRIGLPQLEQVILNLTMNARDAMPRGGVIVIETSETDIDPSYAARHVDVRPDRYLRLRVTDTGTGMTPEVASRAFEPFFTTKRDKGTGLGLSTVYGIVKQAGGHVILSSEQNAGTRVDVFFPIVRDGVATDIRPPPSTDAPKGNGETILVVEDSANVRKLVCAMLGKSGYRVLEATTAQNALELLERHRGAIDVLLTDVIMPQMSGRDLALRARGDYEPLTRALHVGLRRRDHRAPGNAHAGNAAPQEAVPRARVSCARCGSPRRAVIAPRRHEMSGGERESDAVSRGTPRGHERTAADSRRAARVPSADRRGGGSAGSPR